MWESIASGGVALGLATILFKSLDKKIDNKADQSICDIHVKAVEEALHKSDESFKALSETSSQILQTLARIDERTKKQNGGK